MAHFAELDENNVVVRVLVVNNDILETKRILTTGEVITEDSQKGIDFLNDLFPDSGTWVQTSYNHNIRYRYAAMGYTYDVENDAFITPQPYPSWKLAPSNFAWKAPVPYPISNPVDGDPIYFWNEETQTWDEV